MNQLVFDYSRWGGKTTLLKGHKAPKGLKFSDNGDDLGTGETPPQNVYLPCKYADPRKKRKRKLTQESKRKNRR